MTSTVEGRLGWRYAKVLLLIMRRGSLVVCTRWEGRSEGGSASVSMLALDGVATHTSLRPALAELLPLSALPRLPCPDPYPTFPNMLFSLFIRSRPNLGSSPWGATMKSFELSGPKSIGASLASKRFEGLKATLRTANNTGQWHTRCGPVDETYRSSR